MSIDIKEIKNSIIWENFLLEQQKTPFFQSWWWGEVQKKCGFLPLRLGVFKKGKMLAILQSVKVTARRGNFFWARHGPVMGNWSWSLFDLIVDKLRQHAKKDNVSFIRISPLIVDNLDNRIEFRQRGFRSSPIHNMDAENTWVIDLADDEETLLSKMRKTTRYLIRKAVRMGVRVEQTTEKHQLKKFLMLYKKTAQRQKFVPHRGINHEFEVLAKQDAVRLFLAYYKRMLIAGALIIFYGKEAVYHHSGLRGDMKNIPAPYLIQWQAIKEARRQGKKRYNLWGIAPEDKPNHPWQGLTIFKKGFGGCTENHIHAQDLPISALYLLTWFIETVRRIKKGY